MSVNEERATVSATDRRNQFATLVVLAAILVAGFALRIYRLGDECIWLDEGVSYPYLHLPTLGAYLDEVRAHDPPMSPLYFAMQYYWARIAGGSIVAVRWMSIVFGLASIVMIYALGARLYTRGAGLIAALCTALSIPHVYYSQEIRMYALVLFLALASMYTLVRALHEGQRRWWVLHLICNALILSAHLFGALLIVTQGCYVPIVHGRRWRLWTVWGSVHVVLFIPFLIRVLYLRGAALDHAISFIPTPSLRWLLNTYAIYYAGVEPWGGRLPGIYWPVAAVLALILVLALRSWFNDRHGEGRSRRQMQTFLLLALWFLLPPFLLYVLSFAVTPCFIERYTLYSSFALYVIAGGALAAYRRPWWTALVLCAIAAGYVYAWSDVDRPFRLNYRKVAIAIEGASRPDEPIIGWNEIRAPLLGLYTNKSYDDRFIHTDTVEETLGETKALSVSGHPCWVILYDGPHGDPRARFESSLRSEELRYHRTDIGGLRTLYVYHVAAAEP